MNGVRRVLRWDFGKHPILERLILPCQMQFSYVPVDILAHFVDGEPTGFSSSARECASGEEFLPLDFVLRQIKVQESIIKNKENFCFVLQKGCPRRSFHRLVYARIQEKEQIQRNFDSSKARIRKLLREMFLAERLTILN